MGRTTKNYRQSKSSRSASESAQSYAKIQRLSGWRQKIFDWLKIKGKNKNG